MAKKPEGFENYPLWIVLLINLVSLSVYASGLYLFYLVWPVLAVLFFIYVLYLEFSIYQKSCTCCYYYGKICAFGRGKIAKIFFKKVSGKNFLEKQVSMKDLLPQFVATLAPLFAGIYLLVQNFNWLVLVLMLWPLIVMFSGNPVIYGQLACPHCKQARIRCPACEFFMEMEKKGKKSPKKAAD